MNVIMKFIDEITDGGISAIEAQRQGKEPSKPATIAQNTPASNKNHDVVTKFENIASGIVAVFVIVVMIGVILGQKSPSSLIKGGNIMVSVVAFLCTAVEVVLAFLSMIFFIRGTVHVVLSAFCEPYAEALADNSERLNLDLKKAQNRNDASATTRLQPQASQISVDANIMATRAISHRKQIFPNYMFSIVCGLLIGVIAIVYAGVITASVMSQMPGGIQTIPSTPSTYPTLNDLGTIISLW